MPRISALCLLCLAPSILLAQAPSSTVTPASMPSVGTVDPRFQSYNIEMVEVVGGRFWKPYSSQTSNASEFQAPKAAGATPAGMDPNLFEYRSPIDLTNARLRKLAAALGPAYVRVSGTWANSVYFDDSDNPATNAPTGFNGVLTRKEWKGVIDFAHATNAEIVTSFATSVGTRDANGVWTPEQARKFLAYTKSAGGKIAATEFMNEPTLASMGGAPKGYDAAAYAHDIAVFRPFLKQASPETLFVGPGSVAEGLIPDSGRGRLKSEDLLQATGPAFDVFSYHLYAAVSKRCANIGAAMQTSAADALSREWFLRVAKIDDFYTALRDRFEPGKPIWITETADAACGGNPWASTFLDSFRYLDQHGRLARRGLKVIMHNTLAASDYGLIDEKTFAPRPNYWAALLWRQFMGATVLDPKTSPAQNAYVYAHCLQSHPGGVALLVINADQQQAFQITLPTDAQRYTLTAKQLQDRKVQLNGKTLEVSANGDVPQLAGEPTKAGRVSFAPVSITFLAIPSAGNNSCK